MLRPILSLKRTEYNGPTNSFGANWPGGSILAARIAVMAFRWCATRLRRSRRDSHV